MLSSIKYLFLFVVLFLFTQQNDNQMAVGIDQEMNRVYVQNKSNIEEVFWGGSDFTVGFITCNNITKLKMAFRSFMYYNTELIKELIIYDYCNKDAIQDKYWEVFSNHFQKKEDSKIDKRSLITIKGGEVSYLKALEQVGREVDTRFLLILDENWHVTGPFGFLQKAKDVLKRASFKVFQLSLYPTNCFSGIQPFQTPNRVPYFVSDPGPETLNAFIIDLQKGVKLNWVSRLQQCKKEKACEIQMIYKFLVKEEAFIVNLGGSYPQKVTKQSDIKYLIDVDN